MSRRARATVALDPTVGVVSGLRSAGRKVSRFFHRGNRNRDKAVDAARAKFRGDRSRVDTLLSQTGTKKTGEGFLK